MSRFVALTIGSEQGAAEGLIRADAIVALVPFLQVDRPRAEPRVIGTMIRLESGPDVFVRESVSEITKQMEDA